MLTGLLAQIIEWALAKGFLAAEGAVAAWLAKRKEAADLKANAVKLQDTIKQGSPSEIENAGENSLNNSPRP